MDIKRTLIETYEKYALDRDKAETHTFKRTERNEFLKYLRTEEKRSILDIGCGPGHDSQFFKDNGFDVLATDIAPTMVSLCQQKGVRARVLDCYDLESLGETFDAVYSMNCLLHIPKKDFGGILGLIRRKMNNNGLFYLGIWGGEDFEGIWEGDRYDPKRFFSFCSASTLFSSLHRFFTIEYYRRIVPWEDATFNSVILRKE